MQHSAYLRNHASKLYQTFCGLLCLLWHFNVLCTSGLVHDIMLSHNGLCGVGDASKASVRLGRSLVFAFALFFSHRILCQCAVQNYRTVVRCEHVINRYDTKCCFNMRSKAVSLVYCMEPKNKKSGVTKKEFDISKIAKL